MLGRLGDGRAQEVVASLSRKLFVIVAVPSTFLSTYHSKWIVPRAVRGASSLVCRERLLVVLCVCFFSCVVLKRCV